LRRCFDDAEWGLFGDAATAVRQSYPKGEDPKRTGSLAVIRLRVNDVIGPIVLAIGLALTAPAGAAADDSAYRQTIDGVTVYFGIVPAELVRGHPREHPESTMHGGTPVGENHIMVGLFESVTGERITNAKVTARVSGSTIDLKKTLEPMVVAGNQTFGNYFYMPGAGPYRIEIYVQRFGAAREVRATFTWARS